MQRLFFTFSIVLVLANSTAFAQRDTTVVKQRGGAILASKDTTLAKIQAQSVIDTVPLAVVSDSMAVVDAMIVRKQPGIVRFFKKDYPNPRKAVLLSFLLPGAGQAYNRRWWKIPLVYGALAGVGYLEYNNIQVYRKYRDNYRWLVDEDPATEVTDPVLIRQDRTTMKANRDIARKNLEQSSLILGLAYILSVTDAFVDAHLRSFDVSDDLSLKICPNMSSTPGFGATFGVGIQLAF
jgi:hypothetical protein